MLIIPKTIYHFRKIIYSLSTKCNLKCPTCFRTNMVFQDVSYDKEILKKELLKHIYSGLEEILFSSTLEEPFLYKDIFEILTFIRTKEKLLKKEIHIQIETNASFGNEEFWEKVGKFCNENNITLCFTICGSTPELHNHYRRGSKLDKMLKNIYTVLKYTDNYIISLLKFKYNYIDINNYKQWNFINNFNQDKIVITDTNLFNEKVYNKEEFNDFNSHKPYIPPTNFNRCPALEQQTIQVENGKFYPCTRFQYEHKAIENNPEDIQKVYNDILQNKYNFCETCTTEWI